MERETSVDQEIRVRLQGGWHVRCQPHRAACASRAVGKSIVAALALPTGCDAQAEQRVARYWTWIVPAAGPSYRLSTYVAGGVDQRVRVILLRLRGVSGSPPRASAR
jgi:hypothetical protein